MPPESQADEINPSLEISFSSRKKSATLPTMACWKPPIRPYAIRMPDKYRVPSHIFSCISTYMWGSYDSGRRTSTELASAAFYEYALSQSSAELITSIRSLASFLQAEKYRQAGPLMRLAALQMEDVLRTEPVDLLTCLLEINLELQLSAPELVKSLMRYSADMAKVHFKFPEHPVRILTHQLATLDCTEVAAEAYAVQLKVWQDIRDSSFGRVGDSMAIGCVWITGLGVAAGFQDLPSRLIPRLDDLTLRMAAAMKGSTWCEELFQSYAGSGNIQLFANNSSGEAVKISMQLPGKPTEMVSTQPVARYKLAHLNARCQHFAAEERSQQEAMEAKWLLATDMGSFFVRIMGAIQEWLAEIKEHSLAAAVTRYREKFAAAGLVDIEDYVTGSIGKPT